MSAIIHKISEYSKKKIFRNILFVIYLIGSAILVIVCNVYIFHAWKNGILETETEAVQLAEVAEAGIPKSYISKLDDDFNYSGLTEYVEVRHILSSIAKLNNNVRFTYIYIEKEGEIYFVADSEPVWSEDYSPPGQEYIEAEEKTFLPFRTGKTVLTKPTKDRWGNWVSVLVPMKSLENGEVIAVFGVDFPAETWNETAIARTMQAGLVSLCILFIYSILSFAFVQNRQLYKEKGKLLESERSKSVFLANLPGMAYRCSYDRKWTMHYISAGCMELTGYPSKSLINNRNLSFNDLIMPQYQEYLWESWKVAIQDGSKLKEEYEIITASGEIKWVYEQGQAIYDENNNIEALEGLLIDITSQKEQEKKFRFISEHDTISGLHNRRYLEAILPLELESSRVEKHALVLVNIRRFNMINITYGYFYGEKLIKEMVELLLEICQKDHSLFHISIDRFAILIHDYQNQTEISDLCDTIIRRMQNLRSINNVQASLGIVELKDDKMNADYILKLASIAAEQASKNQTLDYCFFNQEMEERITYKELMKEELAHAAVNDDDKNLFLVYQPIVDLKTGKIYGFETLARFKSESLGWVSPADFIPIAEETGIIVSLGKRIMRQAFEFLKSLELQGYDHIMLSFNVSAIQLLQDDFIQILEGTISEADINPVNLNIELTESVFSNDYEEINRILAKIKERDIKVSIDDFGTGYSSLARERELIVNCIKIDKYFIDHILTSDAKEYITGDIISMAHKLGHYVVAEGVECEIQKQYLMEYNCDYLQGYLFSKPLSPEMALELLEIEEKGCHAYEKAEGET